MLDVLPWHNSVRGWLDTLGRRTISTEIIPAAATLADVRQAMLDAAERAESITGASRTRLVFRINAAHDAQALWYLRSDLMQLVSAAGGELEAWRQLDSISALFRGLIPAALHPGRSGRYDGSHPSRRTDD